MWSLLIPEVTRRGLQPLITRAPGPGSHRQPMSRPDVKGWLVGVTVLHTWSKP